MPVLVFDVELLLEKVLAITFGGLNRPRGKSVLTVSFVEICLSYEIKDMFVIAND